jgi:hypothetical protein
MGRANRLNPTEFRRCTMSESFVCKGCGEEFDGCDESIAYPGLCDTCGEVRDSAPSELQTLVDNWVETDRVANLGKLIDFARELDQAERTAP